MPHYHVIACKVLWREICHFASLSDNSFTFSFLKQGLHDTPKKLNEALQFEITNSVPEEAEAVLIGYGLCSNGLAGIKAFNKPLVAVRAHDCITFLLGSKERYSKYFNNKSGTYWYSSGWIEGGMQPGRDRFLNEEKIFTEKYGEENAKYLLQMDKESLAKYDRATYIDFQFIKNDKYRAYTKECADFMQWEYDEVNGSGELISDWLNGKWDNNRFLCVKPNEVIVPSNNETIITFKPEL